VILIFYELEHYLDFGLYLQHFQRQAQKRGGFDVVTKVSADVGQVHGLID